MQHALEWEYEAPVLTIKEEDVDGWIDSQTAQSRYTPNDFELTHLEYEVMSSCLAVRPEYLFVEHPPEHFTGMEMFILKRHGFNSGGIIRPYKDLFYSCIELLLSEKQPQEIAPTKQEIFLVENAEYEFVTKRKLMNIVERHGFYTFRDHIGCLQFFGMSHSKKHLINGLKAKFGLEISKEGEGNDSE
ncbi:hypothetical protein [Hydrogenovibrio marinus]|uniref:Uncharacterized protein n=1 Tax=Hydrogenovibrio marinus TaxID=28885 RepID=A0A066ZMI4_HYDMR|nr:hypothetical protein [Hydrogenovibrio marinus]KDN94677.1 hypothetical protein EI16_12320 [Hydrogenovibrio marinus]